MKPGRNDPCLCGSGKKFKKCCATKFEAGLAARNVITNGVEPTQAECSHLAGLYSAGHHVELENQARSLIERYPKSGFAWKVLGISLGVQGKEGLPALKKAADLLQNDPAAHYNLGIALQNIGQLDAAVVSYRRALEIKPDFAEAHNDLGNALRDIGQLDDAAASFRRALVARPDFAEAHSNLGNVLRDLGQPGDAATSYRRALEIRPNFAEAHSNLGVALQDLGQLGDALASFRLATRFKPDFVDALNNFVDCVKHLRFMQDNSSIRADMVRALTVPWGRPSELARISIDLIKINPDIGKYVTRAVGAWPMRLSAQDLFAPNGIATISSDPLLHALLISTPICDIEMERFLTMVRYALLEAATKETASCGNIGLQLSICSALAHQSFINEYVFTYTDDEIQNASALRGSLIAALEAQAQIPAIWPVIVAAYFPLCALPLATRLLERQWPEEVSTVLVQQICEPEEELQMRTTIPRLTNIEDKVSLLVQSQYEENPYPRWIMAPPARKAKNIIGYLRHKFPLSFFNCHNKNDNINILIAGCGTGQHAIATAQQFQGAKVLAIDLSLSSLCYAKRKTRELGLNSIEYAQADLLNLGSLGRSFDVIESVGVLHHLADPWAGWRAVLSLLRPSGFMKLGFYSEIARQNIVRARAFIAEQAYGSTAEDIRLCRQNLMGLDNKADFRAATKSLDFFSISTCRDLLFHVQEHRMTLTSIDAFLRDNNLIFLGFDIDPQVLRAYKLRFPNDRAATNLGQWQLFENENPDTFFSMYQFWIQKAG